MTDDELRAWAETTVRFWEDDEGAVPMKVARGILRLLDENAALRKQVAGHCERIAAQSALLSKRAESNAVQVPPSKCRFGDHHFEPLAEKCDCGELMLAGGNSRFEVFDGSTGLPESAEVS